MSNLNLTDRHTIRDLLYGMLNTYLTSTNSYVHTFYNHSPTGEEVQGKSPIGWIAGAGSETKPFTVSERKTTTFNYVVQVGILLSGDVSEDLVEDRLDLINKAVRDYLLHEDQRVSPGNYFLLELGQSVCGYSEISGKEYRTEVYPISVTVKDN